MDFHKDYYKVLGVLETATETEIKLAYRRLAVRFHPDRNPGKPEFEELIQQINEAKDILLDREKRFAYDEYRRMKEKNDPHKSTINTAESLKQGKKQPATRTRKMAQEVRIYVTGTISIKYFAPQDMDRFDPSLRESYYRINPTEAIATIHISDCIWSETDPPVFAEIFESHPLFTGSVPQPVPTVVLDEKSQKHYALWIQKLRIPEPKITLVAKHESHSYGTITGNFYGFVRDMEEHDVKEPVEEENHQQQAKDGFGYEFSGPTGRAEQKQETGSTWMRTEYYYPNGSRFWGNWYNTKAHKSRSRSATINPASSGCAAKGAGILIWLLVVGWIIIQVPSIIFLILFYILLFLLSRLFTGWTGGSSGIALVFLLLLAGMTVILATQSDRASNASSVVAETTRESMPQSVTPIKDTTSDLQVPDTIITRFRQWSDYNGQAYSGTYSYRSSALHASEKFKIMLSVTETTAESYDSTIYALKENDAGHMAGIYRLFDSLSADRQLTRSAFAEMIVSFVQDMPYSIVLDNACDASLYNDAFISRYLSSPAALCEPFQRFGIYSPLEFIANANGDCDSRTLFCYLVLSHYGYNVALLSSEVFHHSVIGINLPYSGKAYDFRSERFVVWETTATNMRPGVLPPEISNMRNWRISLLNKL